MCFEVMFEGVKANALLFVSSALVNNKILPKNFPETCGLVNLAD